MRYVKIVSMLKEKKIPRENKTIRIHPTMLIQLKKISNKTGLTSSELIRDAIEQYISRYKLDEKRK